MKKRDKRRAKSHQTDSPGRVARRPITAAERAEVIKTKPKRCCYHCVFYVSNLLLWLQTLPSGFPVAGMCANHADTPGRWREALGRPCRNFRAKPFRTAPPDPPNDKIRYIPLTRGLHAIVDAQDYEWLSKYKWHALSSGRKTTFYAMRMRGRGRVLMHRAIMNPPEGMVVHHINGNGLDNRRCNLRICTPAQNTQNARRRAGTRSRFIGVRPRGDKWQVSVMRNGKTHWLPLIEDEVEAAKARDRLARELHGEYARLNFPTADDES